MASALCITYSNMASTVKLALTFIREKIKNKTGDGENLIE